MGFFIGIIVSIALAVVGELIRPKQAVPNAKASAVDDFDIPTAESGRIISLFTGKVRIDGSNVTWYGDLSVNPLTRRVKTGLFSSKRQTYAFQYRIGLQHVLGFGGDDVTLHRVLFDELEANHAVAAQSDGSTIWTFNDEGLFGGNESEGGVSGVMHFYPGNNTQIANTYLATEIGEAVPAWRNLAYAVFQDFYVGTSKFIKPVSFEVSTYPNELGVTGGKHIVGEDSNAVCFAFKVLTNQVWGVGKPASTIDVAQFRLIAGQVYDEGLGFSAIYNGATSAEDMLGEIMRHIDGVIFSDPQTGLVTIRLARNDYVVADLPVYGEADFIEPPKFSRPSWSETRNTLTVTFTDRENEYASTPVVFQDQANIEQRGGEISTQSVDFGGFTTREAMTDAGMRSLKAYAYPLASLSGRLRRNAWRTRPADVIVVNWPSLGIDMVVFRITNVTYGSMRQNSISIDSLEDVFSVGSNAYDPPPQSGWENPARPPAALMRQTVIEAPFFMTDSDDATVVAFATQSGPLDEGVDIQTGLTASVETSGSSLDFTTSALLSVSVAAFATSATLAGFGDAGELNTAPSASDVAAGDTIALIQSATTEEWISYTGINIGTGALTGLQRGLFDTVPQPHPIGAKVFFVATGAVIPVNASPIATFPTTLYVRLLPYSALGTLPEGDGTTLSLSVNQRARRPLAPGRIRAGGTRPDLIVSPIAAPFSYTWEPRNRNTDSLVTQDTVGIAPETDTTYTISVYNASNTLLVQKVGIAGGAKSALIDTTFVGNLRVTITAVRNGLSSYQVRSDIIPISVGGAGNTITADEPSYVLDGGGA